MKLKQASKVVPMAPAPTTDRAGVLVAALVGALVAASAGAQGLEFDVSSVQTSVMTILGVGVAIALAFAVYKVGKRATSRM